ncbi:hypothetical protein FACS1894133_4350 [Clostridia bacterium]|nr:hypothetical protein FACS1894133_4350 [Clostridia bacterium]
MSVQQKAKRGILIGGIIGVVMGAAVGIPLINSNGFSGETIMSALVSIVGMGLLFAAYGLGFAFAPYQKMASFIKGSAGIVGEITFFAIILSVLRRNGVAGIFWSILILSLWLGSVLSFGCLYGFFSGIGQLIKSRNHT